MSFVVSPTAMSMSVGRERKHPLIDTIASKHLPHPGKFSGLPQNLGTACFILLNSPGPTFTLLSTNSSSLLASSTHTTPRAGKFSPARTPSYCSLLGLDWPSPRARSLAIHSSSWPCLHQVRNVIDKAECDRLYGHQYAVIHTRI